MDSFKSKKKCGNVEVQALKDKKHWKTQVKRIFQNYQVKVSHTVKNFGGNNNLLLWIQTMTWMSLQYTFIHDGI